MRDQEHTPRGSASDPGKGNAEARHPEPVEADETQLVGPGAVQPGDAEAAADPNPPLAGDPRVESDRAQPSFAADSDSPQWTAAATDGQRWDGLFHDADPASDVDAFSPVSAASPTDSPAEVPTTDPAGLPGGRTPPPAVAPAVPPSPAAPQDSYLEPPTGQPGEPAGGPYGLPPAGTQPARRRDGRKAAGKGQRTRGLLIGGALLGLLALGLLVWALIALISGLTSSPDTEPISNGAPGADGIIAEDVLPIDLDAGQCLRDFVDINTGSTVVTCSTPHNAQLLATEFYADGDQFPGEDALALRAQQVCDGVDLDETAVSRYENLELFRVTPQQNAWSDGDRRLDCLVTSSEGNIISDTLITD
ncbi:hypothetical protein [Arthrobacter sp. HLT1-21]